MGKVIVKLKLTNQGDLVLTKRKLSKTKPRILLTWNCTHIHNIAISRQIERICARAGWTRPAICTPFDLLAP